MAPSGEFDLAAVAPLDAVLTRLRDVGFTDAVVDLRELTFVESREA